MFGGLGEGVGVIAGERAFDRVRRPVLLLAAEEPALLAGHAFVGQALMLGEVGGVLRDAVALQVRGAGGDLEAMRREDARLHA